MNAIPKSGQEIETVLSGLFQEVNDAVARIEASFQRSLIQQIHPELVGYLPATGLVRFSPQPWGVSLEPRTNMRANRGVQSSNNHLFESVATTSPLPLNVSEVHAGPLKSISLAEAKSEICLKFSRLSDIEPRPIREWEDFDRVVIHFSGMQAWRCYQEFCHDTIAVLARNSPTGKWIPVSMNFESPPFLLEPALSRPGCRILQEFFHFPSAMLRCEVRLPRQLTQSLDDQFDLMVVRKERFTGLSSWSAEQILSRVAPVVALREEVSIVEIPPHYSWSPLGLTNEQTLHEVLNVEVLDSSNDRWCKFPRTMNGRDGWWIDYRFEVPRLVVRGLTSESPRTFRVRIRAGNSGTQATDREPIVTNDGLHHGKLLRFTREVELAETLSVPISSTFQQLARGNAEAFRQLIQASSNTGDSGQSLREQILDGVSLTLVTPVSWEGIAFPGEQPGRHRGLNFQVVIEEAAFPDNAPALFVNTLDRFLGSLAEPPRFHQLTAMLVGTEKVFKCKPRFQ
ncbi:MAG TPA: type VI secretion system baseplate subunit TssF [Planctomycetaceae bacterium]|nr:type VI secretion system baseplate subunit TssF [Planctomycetaceae bacterium]